MDWMSGEAGRRRVVIEGVTPEIDGGRFPIKRVVGEKVVVEADAFADGHDAITCRLLFRPQHTEGWNEAPMAVLPNDRWSAEFTVTQQGPWQYTVTGWVDRFKTWRRDLKKRVEAGEDVARDLLTGAALVRETGRRAEEGKRKTDARILAALGQDLEAGADLAARLRLALDDELLLLMDRHADRRFATTYRELAVVVDRERARFSAWYEMLPRATGPEGVPGVSQDAAARLPSVAQLGFDVLCLPPVQFMGTAAPEALDELRRLCGEARALGLEVALDLACGCPPEAFETDSWPALWQDLKRAVDDRIAGGVRMFRVAGPHPAPFPFWEWLLAEVKRESPDVLFLAGPVHARKIRDRLAKLGFTQSACELPAGLTRHELVEWVSELQRAPRSETLRATLWASPSEGREAFVQRLLLAATLGASYGIADADLAVREEGGLGAPSESLCELIALVHRIRRENPALQTDRGLRFHAADNEAVLCYSKVDGTGDNLILVAVNLDPQHVQSAWVELPVDDLGLPREQPYQVHDLLTGARYLWHGSRNFIQLDPRSIPAHVFRVRRQVRTARGFGAPP